MGAQNSRGKIRRLRLLVALSVPVLGGAYLAGGLILFDLSSPAYAFDEETRNGRPVAIGPSPRGVFFRPTRYNIHFAGDEWPFAVYRPLCWLWCRARGFEQAR